MVLVAPDIKVASANFFFRYSPHFTRSTRTRVLPVLEVSRGNRLHYHLTLENPFPNNPNYFSQLIDSIWKRTKFGNNHIHIHENVNWEWNDYITKFNYKNDKVDWINYQN